jgi:hypothetical protein
VELTLFSLWRLKSWSVIDVDRRVEAINGSASIKRHGRSALIGQGRPPGRDGTREARYATTLGCNGKTDHIKSGRRWENRNSGRRSISAG